MSNIYFWVIATAFIGFISLVLSGLFVIRDMKMIRQLEKKKTSMIPNIILASISIVMLGVMVVMYITLSEQIKLFS